MTALAMTSSDCKRQTYSRHRGSYIGTITASVQLENKIAGRESQGACHKDELAVNR
jgi:hypothetical protein